MLKSLLRLWLAVFLIVLASAALLLMDRKPPRGSSEPAGAGSDRAAKVRSVALFQNISQATIDEGARGVLAGLAEAGYEEGTTLRVHRYCAEGDTATSHMMARAIVGGDDELIVTLSTPSLQAVAGANRETRRPHVFGMVSDPVGAGVGIAADDPMKHPPYLVGLGTMQPVAETFRMARRLSPKVAKVGVAWNPSESNSEAGMRLARAVCKELGITLLEASVDSSTAVREAVASLVGQGAEAIWVGGDNTVLSSLEAAIVPARSRGVPVFTSIPGSAARGTLFDLGADYFRVGKSVGRLAGRVLDGESPSAMPIHYEVPPELWINRVALATLAGGWSIPPEVDAQADVVVEQRGPVRRHARQEERPSGRRPSRTWKVGLACYSESPVLDELVAGVQRSLKESGLVDGRDYTMSYRNAQGDIGTLNMMIDALNGDDTDLIIAIGTVTLQATVRKVDRKPVVFAGVLDPVAAGAGKSDSDHRPNVTGVSLSLPYAEMARTVRQLMPNARRVGTLFATSEVNSVLARQRFVEPLRAEGLELVSLPVDGPAEVPDAAASLCQSGVDVICQISDALTNASFPAIARAAATARRPLFTFAPTQVKLGAVLAVGADFAENGRDAGRLAAEVIRGHDPAKIPFRVTTRAARAVNLETARQCGIAIPESWIKTADEVLPARPGTR